MPKRTKTGAIDRRYLTGDKRTKGSGRRKLPEGEKSIQVTFYFQMKAITAIGGMDRCREICLNALNEELNKTKPH